MRRSDDARRRRPAPPVADRERQQHDRAHREPQQDEADRRHVVERVLHELERRAVRDRRRDQRELGDERPRGLPRERDRSRSRARAPPSTGPAVGDREPAILAERLRRHAHTGRGLPALVLVAVDHPRDAAREVGVVPARDELAAPTGRPRRTPRRSGRAPRTAAASRSRAGRARARPTAASR